MPTPRDTLTAITGNTRKEQLENCFLNMRTVVDMFQEAVEKIRTNSDYSESYKESQITGIQEDFSGIVQTIHDNAINVIHTADRELHEKWTAGSAGRLTDQAYQAGLSNTITMLNMGTIDAGSFPAVMEMYKDDINAVNTIRAIVRKYDDDSRKEFMKHIPGNPRKRTEQALKQLEYEVDNMINQNQMNGHNFSSRFPLVRHYYMQTLNDDLSA